VLIALGIKHKMRKFPFHARNLSFNTHPLPQSTSYPLSSQEIRHIDFLTSVFGCRRHKKVHNKQTPIRQAEAVGLHHSTRWWSDYFCFIFVRYSVQISDVRPAMVRGNLWICPVPSQNSSRQLQICFSSICIPCYITHEPTLCSLRHFQCL